MKVTFFTLILTLLYSSGLYSGEVLIGEVSQVRGRTLSATQIEAPHEAIELINLGNQLRFRPLSEENGKVRVQVFRGSFAMGEYYISYEEYERHQLANIVRSAVTNLDRSRRMNEINCPTGNDLLGSSGQIDSDALKGARRVLATMFQSCRSLEQAIGADTPEPEGLRTRDPTSAERNEVSGLSRVRVVDDVDALARSHIFLGQHYDTQSFNLNCVDITSTPPIYAYGGEPNYNSETREIDLFVSNRGVDPGSHDKSISIDCSAFIAAAMASSGLKIAKSEDGYHRHTTVSIHEAGQESGSCVPPAEITPENILQPGDIFNQRSAHVVMIDELGDDPLGVERFSSSPEQCLSITVEDFNFTYIHSGALNGSYGPSRVHSTAHADTPGSMFNQLLSLAVRMCQRKANGETGPISSTEVLGGDAFSLLRHDSDNEDCRYEPTPLKNQECLDDCPSVHRETGYST